MVDEIDPREEAETLRQDIAALLSRDPHCPIAQILGRRLMDLLEE